jgi:peptidoglycan/LPS O-acetylase OafA/YrhL
MSGAKGKVSGGPDSERDRFIEILRGLSIFLVVYWHYVDRVPYAVLNAPSGPLLPFYSGKIGVYIFFAISGYLIAQSMEHSKSLADFYAKRISRIWPLFVVASVVIFAFLQVFSPPVVPSGPKQFYEDPVGWRDLFGSVLFLQDLGFNWVDGVFWSILVELKFYVTIGIFASVLKKNYVHTFAVYAAALSILDFGLMLFGHGPGMGVANKVLHGLLISQYLTFFSLGVSLYARQLNGLFVANLILAVAQLLHATGTNPTFELEGTLRFLVVFSAFLVVDFALLKSRVMLFFGKYSYAIYLFHQMIGLTIISLFARRLGYEGAMAVAIAVVLTVSVTTSWMFEWRFRRPVARALLAVMNLLRLTRVDVSSRPPAETPVAATAS